MHESVMLFAKETVDEYGLGPGQKILEVGSRYYNGSVKPLFKDCAEYVGVDMVGGDNVDVVCEAKDMDFPDDYFDVVITTEMLEHDPEPWLSMVQMGRVLKPGGVFVFTCRGLGFPYHDFPGDYYRYTLEAIRFLISRYAGLKVLDVKDDYDPSHPGVFAVAKKGQG